MRSPSETERTVVCFEIVRYCSSKWVPASCVNSVTAVCPYTSSTGT